MANEQSKVRYVWGDYVDGGRCRIVYGYSGPYICVTYKAYMRKPEDSFITLYPHRIALRGYVPEGKHAVEIRSIYNS